LAKQMKHGRIFTSPLDEVKTPGPKNRALTSPQRGDLAVRKPMEYWNGGTMEFWVSKADYGLILFFEPCHSGKYRHHSSKRVSSIFHHSTAYEYGTANLV
jgi:hypothetical protein